MNRLETRPLGRTGIEVSVISLGSGRVLRPNFIPTIRRRIKLIQESIDLGIDFFDTADSYAFGWDERVLGIAIRGMGSKVVVASKVGYPASCFGNISKKLTGGVVQKFSRDYIIRQCHRSLRLLQRDAIDVYYLHSPPCDQIAQALETLATLKQQGKIRFTGISFCETRDFLSLPPQTLDVVQIPLSSTPQGLEDAVAKCAREGLGCVIRQPFRYRKEWMVTGQEWEAATPAGFLRALAIRFPASSFLFATQNPLNLAMNTAAFTALDERL